MLYLFYFSFLANSTRSTTILTPANLARNRKLKKHANAVQSNRRTKVCQEQACGKRFAFIGGLNRHVTLVHNIEKNHDYSFC